MIKYGRQFIDNFDKKAVLSTLTSDWLTQGPKNELFEKSLKKKFGAKNCCVVSNGTAALHLTGLALGWKKNDIVISSPISFLASSNCIVYTGARPDFVDIDNNTYNIDINKLEDKIKFYNSNKRKIRAVVATDFAGNPCDWSSLKYISNKYNIQLVNDNCHALGASYKNDKTYATKYADIVTHSYHAVKNITTGEGGAVLTNNQKLCEKIRMLKSHGTINKFKKSNAEPWLYEMKELGYNYRITDIQCALGISQLKKLEKFIRKRKELARIYDAHFEGNDIFQIPKVHKNNQHAYHLYPLLINFDKAKILKNFFFKKMKGKNIKLQVHYIPIHLQPYYKKNYGFKKRDFPVAENFYEQEVSLPIHFSLKKKEILEIIKNIKFFCKIK